ncbi:Ni/Fe hydrogenase subunit alpha [Allokutzneria oryzae]|uniref:Ni/Fe hydrogenase subunit alpha n=1 Tax=Allokutzneria oryzae TaxID=1378989 RepID=A0ABV5ZUY2_9PSEU
MRRHAPSPQLGAPRRAEGDATLDITVHNGRVERAKLRLYPPPNDFEAFLRGRSYTEPPDITARVRGIWPVAHQLSACQAVEAACGVEIGDALADLRRLLCCGEWISCHALHIHLLQAPAFLGYPDALALAGDHRQAVDRGLAIKQAGDDLIALLGGRLVHPVNVRVGGFHSVPRRAELAPTAKRLRRALDAAVSTTSWVAGFDVPDFRINHPFLALHSPARYPIDRGHLRSSTGLDVPVSRFSEHVVDHRAPRSEVPHPRLDGSRYLVGPLARYALNSGALSPLARQAAVAAGLGTVCRNPFRSIVVRAVELVHAIEEALRLIAEYAVPREAAEPVAPSAKETVGHGATEAPGGLLYHRYELDSAGLVRSAVVMPPTVQNQDAVEEELALLVQANLKLPHRALAALCERAIRDHDPGVASSARFLRLRIIGR